jgi:multidrug efflux pump
VSELNEWAPQVFRKLRSLPQLADVNSDQQDRGLQSSLVIDRGTASRFGITSQAVDETLYDAFGQRQVSTNLRKRNRRQTVRESPGPVSIGHDFVQPAVGHRSRRCSSGN